MEEQKSAYLLSGIAKRQQGNLPGAVEDLRIYISGNDRDSDGHFELAFAYALLNEVKPTAEYKQRAIEHFRKCYDLSPSYQRSLPSSAKAPVVALAAKGRELAGVTSEAIRSRITDAVGMLRLAESQADAGDFLEAKRSFDEIRSMPPPPELPDRERVRTKIDKSFRARILTIQGMEASDINSAQTEMANLLRYFPDEPVALETYVRLQTRYSRVAMDDVAGQKIFQTFRNNIDGFMLKGNYKDALSDVNRMLFNFPRTEFAERKYQDILEKNAVAMREATAAYTAGRFEEARKLFEDLRREYPDPGTAQDAISDIDEIRRKLEADLERERERGNHAAMYAIAKEFAAKFPSNTKAPETLKAAQAHVEKLVGGASTAAAAGKQFEAIENLEKALVIIPAQTAAEAALAKSRESVQQTRKTLWEGLQVVPAGRFILGASSPPEARPKDKSASLPLFYIDRMKVSNERYRQFVFSTGQKAPATWKDGIMDPARAEFAVSGVAYAEADAYCRWLGKRLPTEIEWEKAARGPEGLELPYENGPSKFRKAFSPFREGPVNQFPELASPYGVLGMVGPVFDWTSSWFKAYPGNDDKAVLGIPAETFRVVRGGSKSPAVMSEGKPLPVMHRERRSADRRDADLGFRCAATTNEPPALFASDPKPEAIPAAVAVEKTAPAEKPAKKS
ncbi:MAG: SUMF1/EgtB/PvdO family nonheme iron enzyme [Thermoanaerobaculia bacterium]